MILQFCQSFLKKKEPLSLGFTILGKRNMSKIIDEKTHIINILKEYLSLYKKRQVEIKRAVKAAARAAILPSPRVIFNLLDAIIGYVVSLGAFHTIKELPLPSKKTREQLFIGTVGINTPLFKTFASFIRSDESIFNTLYLEDAQIQLLLASVFQQDEEIRRAIIVRLLQNIAPKLLNNVFREIAVFDERYIGQVTESFQAFLHVMKTNS
ncbi:MAG: hypothetical protein DRP02_00290 [Candidatus Gerdarchaeota archaeon]|nr:MAG: hypothetical protein DRO63_04335 [Candidatus Gerdarchaeota archaeon]RLI72850.1 MAG: hypothetical protein DRP02_00290 [Candidatus Gerdarchaeota archaeon]